MSRLMSDLSPGTYVLNPDTSPSVVLFVCGGIPMLPAFEGRWDSESTSRSRPLKTAQRGEDRRTTVAHSSASRGHEGARWLTQVTCAPTGLCPRRGGDCWKPLVRAGRMSVALPARASSPGGLASGVDQQPRLGALAERPRDCGRRGQDVELRLDMLEPLADSVNAEEQLVCDFPLVLARRGHAQHFGFAPGQPEAPQRLGSEGVDLLLEQQRVRVAGEQLHGEPSAV